MKVSALFRPRLSWLVVDRDLDLGSYSLITRGSVYVKDIEGNDRVRLENIGSVFVGHDFLMARTIDRDFRSKRVFAPFRDVVVFNFARDFSGGIVTHHDRPYHQFNTDGSLDLVGPIADSVSATRPSPPLRFRASYWNGAGAVDRDLELFTDIDTNGVRYLKIRRREDEFVAVTIDSNGNASFAGSVTIHDKLDMQNKPIKNLGDPVDPKDAATKQYVDSFASMFKTMADSTRADISVGGAETTVLSASLSIPSKTLLLAVFTGLYAQGGSSVALVLRVYSNDVLIGGLMVGNPGATSTYPVSVLGVHYYPSPTTATIKVTAQDLYNRGFPIKAGSWLRLILIPAISS